MLCEKTQHPGSVGSCQPAETGRRGSWQELSFQPLADRLSFFTLRGAVYAAEREGKCYVIEDESTFASLLDPEDFQGLELVRVYEFDSEADRECYLRNRGWLPADRSPGG